MKLRVPSEAVWHSDGYHMHIIVMGATFAAGNAHSFRNTRFHSLWGVHEFTHSFYIHYISLNLSVLGLCLQINDSGLFAWINLADLSRT